MDLICRFTARSWGGYLQAAYVGIVRHEDIGFFFVRGDDSVIVNHRLIWRALVGGTIQPLYGSP